jgi:hypothetical protein
MCSTSWRLKQLHTDLIPVKPHINELAPVFTGVPDVIKIIPHGIRIGLDIISKNDPAFFELGSASLR